MTGNVRIIGGQWRGRKLQVPDHPGLRPSGDRVRETLFNWLQPRISGARCLDLFAGTGALGLEAASRGAAGVTLVERDRKLATALEGIVSEWPGGQIVTVVCADVMKWLDSGPGPFDLVFIDPPFQQYAHSRVLELLTVPGLLAPDARVYLESPARQPAPVSAPGAVSQSSSACSADDQDQEPGTWWVVRKKTVGEVRMQLLGRAGEVAPI